MYTPALNAELDVAALRKFLHEHPLCALVSQTSNGMVASHIPMVLREDGSGFGTLTGHVARGNSQWQEFQAGVEVLGIFSGPQHYISPTWYPDKKLHGKEVPTWNYTAVHVYGIMRAVEDMDWLLEHLRSLSDRHEVISEEPWRISDAPAEYIAKMARAIVGIELPVSRVEGKWKVSQNRNERDAAGVMDGLNRLGTPASLEMSELVRSRRPEQGRIANPPQNTILPHSWGSIE